MYCVNLVHLHATQPNPHDCGRQTPRPHETWSSGTVGNPGDTAESCCNAGQAQRAVVAPTIGGAIPESQTDPADAVEPRTLPAPSGAWTYGEMSTAPRRVSRPIGTRRWTTRKCSCGGTRHAGTAYSTSTAFWRSSRQSRRTDGAPRNQPSGDHPEGLTGPWP